MPVIKYKNKDGVWTAVYGGGNSIEQIQSDFMQNDDTQPDYIKNKPEITNEIEQDSRALITSGAIYDLVGDIDSVISQINVLIGAESNEEEVV